MVCVRYTGVTKVSIMTVTCNEGDDNEGADDVDDVINTTWTP